MSTALTTPVHFTPILPIMSEHALANDYAVHEARLLNRCVNDPKIGAHITTSTITRANVISRALKELDEIEARLRVLLEESEEDVASIFRTRAMFLESSRCLHLLGVDEVKMKPKCITALLRERQEVTGLMQQMHEISEGVYQTEKHRQDAILEWKKLCGKFTVLHSFHPSATRRTFQVRPRLAKVDCVLGC